MMKTRDNGDDDDDNAMRKFGPNAKCIISFSISLLKSGQMSNCQGPAKAPVQTPVWNVSKH